MNSRKRIEQNKFSLSPPGQEGCPDAYSQDGVVDEIFYLLPLKLALLIQGTPPHEEEKL